jgi:hypothetical protein
MKPLWLQTLAWIAAVLAALLLALAGPEAGSNGFDFEVPHGAGTPR